VLIASLYLIGLHGGRVDSVYDKDKVVTILLMADDIKMSGKLITVQVATNCDKLPLTIVIDVLEQIVRVLAALFSELFRLLMPFCRIQYRLVGLRALRLSQLVWSLNSIRLRSCSNRNQL